MQKHEGLKGLKELTISERLKPSLKGKKRKICMKIREART
jgi:hypothetical protein